MIECLIAYIVLSMAARDIPTLYGKIRAKLRNRKHKPRKRK